MNIIVIIVVIFAWIKEDLLLSLSKEECCDIDASCTAAIKNFIFHYNVYYNVL